MLRDLDPAGLTELQPVPGDGDLRLAGPPGAVPVAGLLVLRYDAGLYTANVRSVNRKIIAAVDARPTAPDVLVLDASAVNILTVTVIDALPQLERELVSREVTFWLAGLPPGALATAGQLPRWRELDETGRVHPTALAAVRAYREHTRQ